MPGLQPLVLNSSVGKLCNTSQHIPLSVSSWLSFRPMVICLGLGLTAIVVFLCIKAGVLSAQYCYLGCLGWDQYCGPPSLLTCFSS